MCRIISYFFLSYFLTLVRLCGEITSLDFLFSGCRVKHLHQLIHHALALCGVIAANGGGDAMVEVIRQHDRVELFQRRLHSLRLLDDVNAVGIVFYHALHAANVALDGLEPVEQVFFVSLHPQKYTPPPLGGGGWNLSTIRRFPFIYQLRKSCQYLAPEHDFINIAHVKHINQTAQIGSSTFPPRKAVINK